MNKCCGCVSLRRGSLIIATLNLLFGVAGVVYGIVLLAGGSNAVVGWMAVGAFGGATLMAIFLSYAVEMGKKFLLKIWALVSAIIAVVSLTGGLAVIFVSNFIFGIIFMVAAVLQGYCVLIVYSYANALYRPITTVA